MTLARLVFDSYVCAPPARVFAFHERAEVLQLLTPWWSGARVSRPAASLEPGAHVLDAVDLDDATLERRVRADLGRLFPHVDFARWRTLRMARTPCSQFAQPPGARSLVATRTQWDGLYLAGEITEYSSINGALRSGEAAARAVLTDQLQRT